MLRRLPAMRLRVDSKLIRRMSTHLKYLHEIPDGEACSVEVESKLLPPSIFAGKRRKKANEGVSASIILARKADNVYGYLNRCPHMRLPLEWFPDKFMSVDGLNLQCATHGALFDVETGVCIHGPCIGKALSPVEVSVGENGEVLLPN
ncbi:hypothetical protein AAMO2058_000501600 [Amorphochlora amoebiformis]